MRKKENKTHVLINISDIIIKKKTLEITRFTKLTFLKLLPRIYLLKLASLKSPY